MSRVIADGLSEKARAAFATSAQGDTADSALQDAAAFATAAQGNTADSALQPFDLSEIGVGQTWQNITASRLLGVNYTNTTGKPIGISIDQVANGAVSLFIDDIQVATMDGVSGASLTLSSIVPVGAVYRVSGASAHRWFELR